MQRIITLVVGLALVAAACGGGTATTEPSVTEPSVTASSEAPAPSSTEAPEAPGSTEGTTAETAPSESSSSTTTTAAERMLPDGAVQVPEFEFALADGTTFVSSQATMPMLMVFWAEW